MQDTLTIYSAKGEELLTTPINEGCKRKCQLMEEDYISVKFSLLEAVHFGIGSYTEWNGETWIITETQDPTYNTSTGGYDYELQFDAEYRLWKNKIFKFTPTYGGREASWSLTAQLSVHLDIFLANLAYHGFTYKGSAYTYEIDSTVTTASKYITYSNTSLLDALMGSNMMAETFDTECWIESGVIHFGKCQYDDKTPIDFIVGKNVEKISRSDSDSDYATRFYIFGGETNIPPRYRKSLIFSADKVSSNDAIDAYRNIYVSYVPEENVTYNNITVGTVAVSLSSATADSYKYALPTSLAAGEYTLQLSDLSISVIYKGSTSLNRTVTCTAKVVNGDEEQTIDTWDANVDLGIATLQLEDVRFTLTDTADAAYLYLDFSFSAENLDGTDATSKGKVLLTCEEAVNVIKNDEYPEISLKIKFTDSDTVYSATVNPEHVSTGHSTFRIIGRTPSVGDKFTIEDGYIYKSKVPVSYFTSDATNDLVVNGVVQNRLMLPVTYNDGKNYIDAVDGLDEKEIVEAVVVNDDIYPRFTTTEGDDIVEGRTTTDVKTRTAQVLNEETDEYEQVTYWAVQDSGITFNKDYILDGEELQIQFTSGKLNGMTFGVDFLAKSSTYGDGQWFEVVRADDYGRYLPDEVLYPEAGDRYILLGWDSTCISELGLVEAAEEELAAWGEKYAAEQQIDPSTYTCDIMSDDAYGKNPDTGELDSSYAYENSLLMGDPVNIYSDAYFETGVRLSRVIGFEKNLDILYDTPQYIIGEKASYSTIANLSEQVDELTLNGQTYTGGTGNSGSNVYLIKTNDETVATDRNVFSALRSLRQFLSAVDNDTAAGVITFLKGILLGSGGKYSISEEGVARLKKIIVEAISSTTITNSGTISTKDLTVTGTAHFFQLIIDKLNSVDGAIMATNAHAKISRIVWLSDDSVLDGGDTEEVLSTSTYAYDEATPSSWDVCRLLWKSTDDNDEVVENTYVENDGVVCWDTKGLTAGTTFGASNKYYWCKVGAVGTIIYTDGHGDDVEYNYIDIYSTDVATEGDYYDGTFIPALHDVTTQLGYFGDDSDTLSLRGNAIIMSAYATPDQGGLIDGTEYDAIKPPSLVQYKGIKTCVLAPYRMNVQAANGNVFKGSFVAIASDGEEYDISKGTASMTLYAFKNIADGETATVPTNATYNFATKEFYAGDNGWSDDVPTAEDGYTTYVTLAVVSGSESNDSAIDVTSWVTPYPNSGSRGEKGDSSISASLSNDASQIACSSDGTPLNSNYEPTTMTLYSGTSVLTATADKNVVFKVSIDGTQIATSTLTSGEASYTLTSTIIAEYAVYTDEIASFEISATYDGTTHTKTYTIAKVRAGDNGDTPTIGSDGYWYINGVSTGIKAEATNGTSVTITDTSVTYQVSTSGTDIPTGTWQTTVPTLSEGQYLWSKTTVTYSDEKSTTTYGVSYKGKSGTSVTISSTSVTYAVTSDASQPADSAFTYTSMPTISLGDYLWTRTYVKYSNNTETNSYSVGRIGTDGEDGEQGATGADGKTSYVHFAYATSSDGKTGFSTTYFTGALYVGTCTDYDSADPTTYSSYEWARLRGEDGTSVTVSSTSVTYSTVHNSTTQPADSTFTLTAIPTLTEGQYLWSKTTVTYSDEKSTTTYAVSRIGENGEDGTSVTVSSATVTYSTVRTSSQPADSTFTLSTFPTDLAKGDYLWSLTKVVYSEGTTTKAYDVSRIGKDGDKGDPGSTGDDGKTSYVHFAYATSSDGKTNFNTSAFTGALYIGTYTDFTEADSTTYTDYTWSRFRGEDGDDITITNKAIEYATSTSGTTAPTSNWQTSVPTVAEGSFLWTRTTITYSTGTSTVAYSVGYTGENGTSVTVSTTSVTYAVNQTGSQPADSEFTYTTIPALSQKDYLWTRTYVKYSDNTETNSYSVGRIGADGDKGESIAGTSNYIHVAYADSTTGTNFSTTYYSGALYIGTCVTEDETDPTNYSSYDWNRIKGEDGKGISSITEQYALNNSSSTSPTSGWSTTVQTPTSTNKYLWNREVIAYTTGTSETTTAHIVSMYAADGRGISNVENYYLAFAASSGVTTSTIGFTTDVQTTDADNKYLWNYEKIIYTNGDEECTTPCIIGVYSADGHSPYINSTTNTWWVWNADTSAYKDSGVTPEGASVITYRLVLSQNTITYDPNTNTYDTDSITAKVYKKTTKADGTETEELCNPSDFILFQYIGGEIMDTSEQEDGITKGDEYYTISNITETCTLVLEDPALDSQTVTLITSGEDGKAGTNAITLDLDNEADIMQYDSAGNLVTTDGVSTTATMYDGATAVDASSVTWTYEVTSGTASVTQSTNTFTVTAMSTETVEVTIKATYNSVTYTKIFSVKKITGTDKYELVLSDNAVKCTSSGTTTPSKITVQVYRTDSSGTREDITSTLISGNGTNTYGLQVLLRQYMNDSYYNTYGQWNDTSYYEAMTFPCTDTYIRYVALLQSSDGTLTYDTETIPVLSDGEGTAGKSYNASLNSLVVKCTINSSNNYIIASDAADSKIYLTCSDSTVTASSVVVTSGSATSGTTLTTSSQYLNNIGYSFSTSNQYIALAMNTNGTLTAHSDKIVVTWSDGVTSTHSLQIVPLVDGSIEDVETTTVYRLNPLTETALIKLSGGGTTSLSQTLNVSLSYSILKVSGETESVLSSLPSGYAISGAYNNGTTISFSSLSYALSGGSYSSSDGRNTIVVTLKNSNSVVVDARTIPIVFEQTSALSVTSAGITAISQNATDISTIEQTASSLQSTVSTLSGQMSTIEQKADSIALKVSNGTLDSKRWNLIDNAYLNTAFFNNLDSCRTLELQAGHTYTMTVCGKALTNNTILRVYTYALLSNTYWVGFYYIDISSTASTTASVTFTVPTSFSSSETSATLTYSEGDSVSYILSPYIYNSSGSTSLGSSYKAFIEWAVIEDGSTSSGEYLLSETDPYVSANMLSGIQSCTSGDSGTSYIQNNGASVSTSTVTLGDIDFYYWYKTGGASTVMLQAENLYDMERYGVYTLSFWAKGSSSSAYLRVIFPSGTSAYGIMSVVSSQGYAYCSQGYVNVTLTTSWVRYWVTFSHNSAYSGAGFSLLTMNTYTYYVAGLKLCKGGRIDDWTDYGVSAMSEEEMSLLDTGIDIQNKKITLTADTTEFVDNSGNVMGVFTDNGLVAGSLQTTTGTSGQYVYIQNGMITVTGTGQSKIEFGCDTNGYPIMRYIGSDGTLLWNIGKDGINSSSVIEESVSTYTLVALADTGITIPSKGDTVTKAQAYVLFKAGYKSHSTSIYRYTAAYSNGVYAKSSLYYTMNTATKAESANGKYYSSMGNSSTAATLASGYYMQIQTVFGQKADATTEVGSNPDYVRSIWSFSSGVLTSYDVYCTASMYNIVNGTQFIEE